MTGDDFAVLIDQDRIAKSEPSDAFGDLPGLFFRVGTGVAFNRL
jgi:hypothetical protein